MSNTAAARITARIPAAGEVARFVGVGVVSTIGYIALYAILRTTMPAQAANALALLVTAVANTAANRRVTFGVRGSAGALRHHLHGLAAFALALAVTSGSLAALHATTERPTRGLELSVLLAANLGATALRFEVLRRTFRPASAGATAPVTTQVPQPVAGDPRWVRPSLLALLTSTGFLYLWGLGASGWANSFYSAAVQASTHSWKAFFFGSLDSGNSITVDKPPAFLWVMDLSARIFGVNSWAILVPEALMGVAAVGLLYLTVRRHFGPAAGLIAGAALAVTPVATLMFRFNNPDALLVLLLVAASYAVSRAVESASTRWLLIAGLLVGTGFITKMLQAFLVVPALGLAYLVAADTSLKRRVTQLLAAAGALVVASGWWVVIVELWPASSRPYIGGSQNNSLLNLIFGYNGLGRITGSETGSVGGGGGPGGMWGKTGLLRMFSSEFGGQGAWLIPGALLLLVATLWALRRAPRTDLRRAQLVIWGGSLLVTGLTFSYMSGIIHPYYTVALAPGTAALVGVGATTLWQRRGEWTARLALSAAILLSSWWAWALLDRTPAWHPWLRLIVALAGTTAAVGICAAPYLGRWLAPAVAAVALVASLVGPAAYSLATAATPHTGSLPSAGPSSSARPGGFPGFVQRPGGHTAGGFPSLGFPGGSFGPGGQPMTGGLPGIGGQFGIGGPPGWGLGQTFSPGGRSGGGLLSSPTPSAALVSALKAGGSGYRWVAATVGSQNAAGYQLGSDEPVMAIGGFNGTDPSPTLAQFQAWVAAGKIHYFIPGGTGFGARGGLGQGQNQATSTASQITSWVESTYRSTTIGGTTVYDLTAATTTSPAASTT
ncbi:MAG TPA: glycosyltransferase family 39 protein [Mycobacteriales bacterium]|nr:glycosyltransferase family 39 protein [Mycobacteriales bacterium]